MNGLWIHPKCPWPVLEKHMVLQATACDSPHDPLSYHWVPILTNYSPKSTENCPNTWRGLWIFPKGLRKALKEVPFLPFEGCPSSFQPTAYSVLATSCQQPVCSLISFISESLPFLSGSQKLLQPPLPTLWPFCARISPVGVIIYNNSYHL